MTREQDICANVWKVGESEFTDMGSSCPVWFGQSMQSFRWTAECERIGMLGIAKLPSRYVMVTCRGRFSAARAIVALSCCSQGLWRLLLLEGKGYESTFRG